MPHTYLRDLSAPRSWGRTSRAPIRAGAEWQHMVMYAFSYLREPKVVSFDELYIYSQYLY